MLELDIAFGKNRSDKNWKNEFLTWDEFVDRLRKVRRTGETMAEYSKMDNINKARVKDGPAFVGGFIRGGRRKKENLETRSLITLDVDQGDENFLFCCDLVLDGTAYVIYSTHSHRPKKPKYRLIIPTDRTMNPDEYAAVSRKIAEQIGMQYFDKTTFDVHRLMYLPSCSNDAKPILEVFEGEPLGVDEVLDQYLDWKDPLEWPRHESDKAKRRAAAKMEDPRGKQGLVGVFCRCYTISEAIDEFLPGVYEPTEQANRYTYVGSSSYGGLVIYDDDTFAYSHHESDPISGREVNAFDLVRIHKFGQLDDKASEKTNITKLPSYTAMRAFANEDKNVKREMWDELSEHCDNISEEEDEDDDAWVDKLKMNQNTGYPHATSGNVELILSHGEWKKVLAYDAFGNT
ncbi:virulence protein E, partial [Paenibacillus larvae]